MTWENLSALLALPPGAVLTAMIVLAATMMTLEYTRISLALAAPHSRVAHVSVCMLTFPLQTILCSFVLIHAARAFPDRAWINLGLIGILHVVWWIAGQSTLIVRRDSQGADVGFMAVGALITLLVGVGAAVLT